MIVPELGHFSLILALASTLVLVCASPLATNKKQEYLQHLTKPAVYSQCFFLSLAFITLTYCFMQNDFTVAYVAENSYSALPLIYKICAVWGAHEGSLLLWSFILSFWTLSFACSRKINFKYQSMTLSVLGSINIGFLILLLHTSNPFDRLLPGAPLEGLDLNPLLQDPGFVLHPPILYMGYVGLAVPFALSITGLIYWKDKFSWAAAARPWALLAWAFLTGGITLGSWWAYYELGWGGWWFWDPVENASFMPWLLGAGFVHALIMSSKSEQFNAWCTFLAISTFLLSLLGTFLVRSGIISSVHAFASDPLRGTFILGFLSLVMFLSYGLYVYRFSQASLSKKVPFLSKESFLYLGNILFLVATLTVLLGTLYPLITEVLWDEKISVGPPYFNQVFVPLMLPILLLMPIAPFVSWNQETLDRLKQKLMPIGIIFGLLVLALLLFLYNKFALLSLIGILLGGWVVVATLGKLVNQIRLQQFHFKFSGMFFAHLGIGIATLGITLTSVLETEQDLSLSVGTSVKVGQYHFTFNALDDVIGPNFQGKRGEFTIAKQGKTIATLYPEKRFFIPRNLPMTETAIKAGWLRDFYIALGEPLEDGAWTVRLYIKPFIRWIWFGGIMIALGAALSSLNTFRQARNYS
jgi:cytochrome c-type biogenesis protein CcmF